MSLVVDSSATLAWIFSEGTTPPIREVLESVINGGAWVPSIWPLEVANILEMSIRRSRCDGAFRDATLEDLTALPIRIDTETATHAWGPTTRLAGRHKLTAYDAAYLELALRRSLPLATLDIDLRAAAQKEKIFLLGL